jgi:hypothetical protein
MSAKALFERHRQTAKWLASLAALIALLLAYHWYTTPVGYDLGRYGNSWQSVVDQILKGQQQAPTSMPGVGRLKDITPSTMPDGSTRITFWPARESDQLVYLSKPSDSRILFDQCVAHLGGDWFQIGKFNVNTMSCPRAFHHMPAA